MLVNILEIKFDIVVGVNCGITRTQFSLFLMMFIYIHIVLKHNITLYLPYLHASNDILFFEEHSDVPTYIDVVFTYSIKRLSCLGIRKPKTTHRCP